MQWSSQGIICVTYIDVDQNEVKLQGQKRMQKIVISLLQSHSEHKKVADILSYYIYTFPTIYNKLDTIIWNNNKLNNQE